VKAYPRILGQLVVLIVVACGIEEEPLPPTAQPEIPAMLRADLEALADPADGKGSAWLVPSGSDVPAVASQAGRWEIVFEAAESGIGVGGAVYLQISPFWGWSTPQVVAPQAVGFTEVTASADGVELEVATLDEQLLRIVVGGRPLAGGERIRIVYGAGPAGARADRFAESHSRLWIAVDGDGDGRRVLLGDSPSVPVVAGDAARLVLHLPSTARRGQRVELTAAVLDASGNAGPAGVGEMNLQIAVDGAVPGTTPGAGFDERGVAAQLMEVPESGVLRVRGTVGDGIDAASNPLVVGDSPRILWADLHGHSALSDGTGSPGDYLAYARDVAALDVVALTDHDHWGLEPLATHPELWDETRRQIELFNEPGRFVALAGYEWTSWIYGHRHVLYFDGEGEILSSVDPRYEHPRQLWRALRGTATLTFAHHSAGGPIATDWRIPPDPELEPVTEIVSVHGSSEAPDSPFSIYRPLPGNFVRDALGRGYRLGFLGSGDSHDGHPGLAQLASPRGGGLAAILSEELTRESVLEAVRARRVYATNGPRIVLETELDGHPMGASVRPRDRAELALGITAVQPLSTVEIVRAGRVAEELECGGLLECRGRLQVIDLEAGEYVYIRAIQTDGGAAWSSPFFVD